MFSDQTLARTMDKRRYACERTMVSMYCIVTRALTVSSPTLPNESYAVQKINICFGTTMVSLGTKRLKFSDFLDDFTIINVIRVS